MIINKLALAGAVLLALLSGGRDRDRWKLEWMDGFDGPVLDTAAWSRVSRGPSDWNNTMSLREDLVRLEDGQLVLLGRVNDDTLRDPTRIVTAGVTSRGRRAFRLARYEVRARFNCARGFWPALWLMPQRDSTSIRDYAEIDLMEHLNTDPLVYQTVHSDFTLAGHKKTPPAHTKVPIDPAAWNTYAAEVHPDSVCFFVNGEKTMTYPRIANDIAPEKNQFPFDCLPFHFILSNQLGGKWVGPVDEADLPSELRIDWVKVYTPRDPADGKPLLRFGVIADAQYDRDTTDNKLHRHYARSLPWLADAMETFNGEDLAFTVSLGDLIDRSADALADIKPVLETSRVPIHYIYGNHDYPKPYDRAVQERIFKTLGQKDVFRAFDAGPVRIILLNTNEIALYSSPAGSKVHNRAEAIYQAAKEAGLRCAKKYNGSLSGKQLHALERELAKARRQGRKVLVMGHSPITPETATALTMNAPEIRSLLSAYEDTILGYLAGHEHKGGLQMLGGIPCITFRGMCEGTHNRYAIVTVYENKLEISGFGDQESYIFER